MASRNLLIAQLIAVSILAALAWVAVEHFLYWRLWWFDMPMHLLGGMWAAFCAAWLMVRQNKPFSLAWCLFFALSVGILWELFEYSEGITNAYHVKYPTDTFKDISMDMVGSVLGWMLAKKLSTKMKSA